MRIHGGKGVCKLIEAENDGTGELVKDDGRFYINIAYVVCSDDMIIISDVFRKNETAKLYIEYKVSEIMNNMKMKDSLCSDNSRGYLIPSVITENPPEDIPYDPEDGWVEKDNLNVDYSNGGQIVDFGSTYYYINAGDDSIYGVIEQRIVN